MKQNIINARVTFRKSPIHVLEKFAFKDMPNACLTFKKNSGVSECVIIQTCNRIELFATSDNHNVDEIKALGRHLQDWKRMRLETPSKCVRTKTPMSIC